MDLKTRLEMTKNITRKTAAAFPARGETFLWGPAIAGPDTMFFRNIFYNKAHPNLKDKVDGFNFHVYRIVQSADTEVIYSAFKSMVETFQKPIYLSEFATYATKGYRGLSYDNSEKFQAGSLIKTFISMWLAGISRASWWKFSDEEKFKEGEDPDQGAHTGLVTKHPKSEEQVLKKSYYAAQLLAANFVKHYYRGYIKWDEQKFIYAFVFQEKNISKIKKGPYKVWIWRDKARVGVGKKVNFEIGDVSLKMQECFKKEDQVKDIKGNKEIFVYDYPSLITGLTKKHLDSMGDKYQPKGDFPTWHDSVKDETSIWIDWETKKKSALESGLRQIEMNYKNKNWDGLVFEKSKDKQALEVKCLLEEGYHTLMDELVGEKVFEEHPKANVYVQPKLSLFMDTDFITPYTPDLTAAPAIDIKVTLDKDPDTDFTVKLVYRKHRFDEESGTFNATTPKEIKKGEGTEEIIYSVDDGVFDFALGPSFKLWFVCGKNSPSVIKVKKVEVVKK